MDGELDYAQLYAELGIDPGCGIDGMRAAYRRLASRLHPDSGGGDAEITRLQELNHAYRAATRFHRLHGRLPGEPARAGAAPAAVSTPVQPQAARPHAVAVSGRRMRSLMLAGVLVALAAWMAASAEAGGARQAKAGEEDHRMQGRCGPG